MDDAEAIQKLLHEAKINEAAAERHEAKALSHRRAAERARKGAEYISKQRGT